MYKASVLISIFFAVGCNDIESKDDTGHKPAFCLELSNSDDWRIEGDDNGGQSGSFEGYLRTSYCAQFDDPDCVAFIAYTVENIDIGSTTQENGITDNYGMFSGKGAEGTWRFVAGATLDGNTCSSQIEFEVESGRTTNVCPVLRCQE